MKIRPGSSVSSVGIGNVMAPLLAAWGFALISFLARQKSSHARTLLVAAEERCEGALFDGVRGGGRNPPATAEHALRLRDRRATHLGDAFDELATSARQVLAGHRLEHEAVSNGRGGVDHRRSENHCAR